MENLVVTCANLHKRYGQRVALDGTTFEIPHGKIVGVLGPNGSGKSTLFRVIMGLTRPDSGTVHVLGNVPGWKTSAQIAYLPDRARWYQDDTVAEAIHWGATLLPHFDVDRAKLLTQEMDLDPLQRVAGMSRGMEARFMIILCLSRHVPLMILDEPLSGIDFVSRERITEALIAWASEEDATILLSTHEISETESLFDHAIFLRRGKVIQQGDTDILRREHGSMRDILRAESDTEEVRR